MDARFCQTLTGRSDMGGADEGPSPAGNDAPCARLDELALPRKLMRMCTDGMKDEYPGKMDDEPKRGGSGGSDYEDPQKGDPRRGGPDGEDYPGDARRGDPRTEYPRKDTEYPGEDRQKADRPPPRKKHITNNIDFVSETF